MTKYVGLFTSSLLFEEIPSERTRPFIEWVAPIFAAAESSDGFICRAKGNYIVSEVGQLTGIEYDKIPSFYEEPALVVQTPSFNGIFSLVERKHPYLVLVSSKTSPPNELPASNEQTASTRT